MQIEQICIYTSNQTFGVNKKNYLFLINYVLLNFCSCFLSTKSAYCNYFLRIIVLKTAKSIMLSQYRNKFDFFFNSNRISF